MSEAIYNEHETFRLQLEAYRKAPEGDAAGMALAVGLLIGGGFPHVAALCALAAELAWPDLNLCWSPATTVEK